MPLPSKVKTGDPIKAADWNQLIDCLRSLQILPSAGVRVTRSPSGTLLAVVPVPPKRGGVAAETWPFQGYPSPFVGQGDPPADQARRFRVRLGVVNSQPPSNINAEFTAAAGTTTWCWVRAGFSTANPTVPVLTSSVLEIGAAIPVIDPPGTGAAPSDVWPLFQISADADAITGFESVTKSSLSVTPITVGVQCGNVTMQYQWVGL